MSGCKRRAWAAFLLERRIAVHQDYAAGSNEIADSAGRVIDDTLALLERGCRGGASMRADCLGDLHHHQRHQGAADDTARRSDLLRSIHRVGMRTIVLLLPIPHRAIGEW
jgi:hypothetical protein